MEKNEIKDIVDTMFTKMKEDDKTQVKLNDLQKSLDEFETKYEKNSLKFEAGKTNFLVKGLNSKEFKSAIENKGFNYEIKADTIVAPGAFIQNGVAPVVLPMRETEIGKTPVRPLLLSQIIQWGTTTSNTIDWVEIEGKTNGSAMRAEGSVMGQGDLKYQEFSTKCQSLSEYMIVSNESLKDANFLASEIQTELYSDLELLLDDQLLNGDGTSNNLTGIETIATAFAAGSFASSVDDANEADVLRVAIHNIKKAGAGRFMPDYILMNDTDLTKLDLLKDSTTGNYIDVPFYSAEGESVKRIPIISNEGIDAGDYLVGDFKRAKGFVRDQLSVNIYDQHASTAISNLATIVGNMRVGFRVKHVDYGAFVKGVFSTDKAALSV